MGGEAMGPALQPIVATPDTKGEGNQFWALRSLKGFHDSCNAVGQQFVVGIKKPDILSSGDLESGVSGFVGAKLGLMQHLYLEIRFVHPGFKRFTQIA